jgi:hypothetical protein
MQQGHVFELMFHLTGLLSGHLFQRDFWDSVQEYGQLTMSRRAPVMIVFLKLPYSRLESTLMLALDSSLHCFANTVPKVEAQAFSTLIPS